jgi:serine/threonine protein phosphatase PrpC
LQFGGKNKTNQDDYFTWEDPDNEGTMVILVLDGHGRELGELASGVAKDSIFASLCHAEGMKRMAANPQETITECFGIAHSAIRDSFVKHYEAAGMETVCEKEGYVTKRRPHMLSWTCAHGGTTASIIVILNGRRMIIGNVGDSTAMLCGAGDIRSKCSSSTYPIENDLEASGADTAAKESFTTLSAEHSPESEAEFRRMRTSKPCPKRGNQSEMVFVYDSPSLSKLQCPEVFALEAADKVRVTGRGQYYKNVRCEWASLVTTPSHARFQDALAFTRSLGDLHMQVYGVSHVPDVAEFDLTECIDEAAGRDSTCLVVCSDGIWDNWTYGDVAKVRSVYHVPLSLSLSLSL